MKLAKVYSAFQQHNACNNVARENISSALLGIVESKR
jgi:hypothetical protein